MNGKVSALIIARPSRLRHSLRVLMAAIPQIVQIDEVDDVPAAMAMKSSLQPAIVLIDFDLSGNVLFFALRHIKNQWSQTHCIVLVDDDEERQVAQIVGADVVMMKGVLAANLATTIEELVPDGDSGTKKI